MVMEAFQISILEGGHDKDRLAWALASTQGRRPEMEDAHAVVLDLESVGKDNARCTSLFGVFDGHGGNEVAEFCAKHMPTQVLQAPGFTSGDLRGALYDAFMAMDQQMNKPVHRAELNALKQDETLQEVIAQGPRVYNQPPSKAGSTAVVALVKQGRLVVGHVGDSRCVVCKGGRALTMTQDHVPTDPEEAERIYSAGGFVATRHGGVTPRVGGTLAMSRAIGDMRYKGNASLPPEEQAVTAAPDTVELDITHDCDFMVLACDGVWDVKKPEEVVHVIKASMQAGNSLGLICKQLVEQCLAPCDGPGPSQDNITLMLVMFGDDIKKAAAGGATHHSV